MKIITLNEKYWSEAMNQWRLDEAYEIKNRYVFSIKPYHESLGELQIVQVENMKYYIEESYFDLAKGNPLVFSNYDKINANIVFFDTFNEAKEVVCLIFSDITDLNFLELKKMFHTINGDIESCGYECNE